MANTYQINKVEVVRVISPTEKLYTRYIADDYSVPPDDGFLEGYECAALATETKSLKPTDEEIYQGLFNIATKFGTTHGISVEVAALALRMNYPDEFEQDLAEQGINPEYTYVNHRNHAFVGDQRTAFHAGS